MGWEGGREVQKGSFRKEIGERGLEGDGTGRFMREIRDGGNGRECEGDRVDGRELLLGNCFLSGSTDSEGGGGLELIDRDVTPDVGFSVGVSVGTSVGEP